MSAQWFVVRAVAGQEKKVKQYLEAEIKRLNVQHIILQVLIPMQKVLEKKDGKIREKEKSYLPGYIFVEALAQVSQVKETTKSKSKEKEREVLEMHPEAWTLIKDVPGVVGFVGNDRGKIPTPMPEADVKRILQRANEMTEKAETILQPFNVGEVVKITDGMFNGFDATIDEINEEKKKLKVMVKIFGRNTSVELNFLQVERIS
jgi:transcriptional antiterminator NusG